MMSELRQLRQRNHHQLEAGDRYSGDNRISPPYHNSYRRGGEINYHSQMGGRYSGNIRNSPPSHISNRSGGEIHYQGQSLAERTISQYNNGNNIENDCTKYVVQKA